MFKFVEKDGKYCLEKNGIVILEFQEINGVTKINNAKGVNLISATLSGESETNITVNTENIKDGAITAAKLAPGVGGGASIADGSVTTSKLADGAVTGVKLNLDHDISGSDLSNTVADGTTIQYDTTNKNLGIKYHEVSTFAEFQAVSPGEFYKTTADISGFQDASGVNTNTDLSNGTIGMIKKDISSRANAGDVRHTHDFN